jgi:hypothetical protein
MPSAAAVRVVARQQPVGRAPRPRIAPATPSAPPVSSAPTTSGTPAATTPTATPISSAAPSTNFQQLLAQLFQSAVAASAGMTPSQQSALSSLEQQWQATDSGAITSSTYASFQDLVSKVMSGTGWSPAASWPATGSGTSSQSTSGTSTAPTGSTQTGSTQTGSTQTGSTQTGWTQTGSTSAGGGWTAPDQSGWR